MATAEGFATDTDDLSQESENEFITAEDSSEVEESDVHEDKLNDNVISDDVTSDDRGMLPDTPVKSDEWCWHIILKLYCVNLK